MVEPVDVGGRDAGCAGDREAVVMSTPEQRARWLRVASAVDLNTNATARLAAVAYKEAVPALLDEVEGLEQGLAEAFREMVDNRKQIRELAATIARLRAALEDISTHRGIDAAIAAREALK